MMRTRSQSSIVSIMMETRDMTAFIAMTKDLLREELKPINNSIAELIDQFKYIKISNDEIKASAEHANSVADAAITRTTSVEKGTTTLELALQECKKEQNILHKQILLMEVHLRRDNPKFDRIKETRGQNCLRSIQEILTTMDVAFSNLPVDRVHRLGPYKANEESDLGTIVIIFSNYADYKRVRAKRNALKGTHIWVKEVILMRSSNAAKSHTYGLHMLVTQITLKIVSWHIYELTNSL